MSSSLLERTPRWEEIPLGGVCMAIGIFLAAPALLLGYEIVRGVSDATPMLAVVVGALGLFFLSIGVRLTTGQQRRSGGLLSPWVLRLGGMFYLLAPAFMFYAGERKMLVHAGAFLAASIACFVLANRRSEERLGGVSSDT